MDMDKIKKHLDKDIELLDLRNHSKASELYVDVRIRENDSFEWVGSIPYHYRRTGLFIESEIELAEYLGKIKKHFTREAVSSFIATEKARWDDEMSGKTTTKPFFDKLLNMQWCSVEKDFPTNPNWARRIQAIKEFGYTLATHTSMPITGTDTNGSHILLVPIPKGGATGYEVMSIEFKNRVITLLKSINVFEAKKVNKHGLIPDHKFSEIRWDEETRESNKSLTDAEIKQKFQLLDNQRNQQKREVCRKCFQTDKRGIAYGINYFYAGTEDWDKDIPKVGKAAEKGCIGCAWYDLQKWRDILNGSLTK